MFNINKVMLIGNLTRDPEMRTTPSGQTVTTLGIATNRTWTNTRTNQRETQTEFHTVICWGRLGEIAGQYLQKGKSVFIEGRLQTRSWQDPKTNEKKYRTEIVAENLQLGPKGQGEGGGGQSGSYAPRQQRSAPNQQGGAPHANESHDDAPMHDDLPSIQEDADLDVKDIPF